MATVRGIAVNGGTAGTIQLRAAKTTNTDTATPADDATIYAHSHGKATRI